MAISSVPALAAAPQLMDSWGSSGSSAGQFSRPAGIVIDSVGDIFVVDPGNNRIQKFDSDGNFLLTWGSAGSHQLGEFNNPWGVAADRAGHVYVTDSWNNRIQAFTRQGLPLMSWGELGNVEDGRHFSSPEGIAWSDGHLYVVDSGNSRIIKLIVRANGQIYGLAKVWGSPGSGSGQFNSPAGVAIDDAGNIYVADQYNNRIQKFDGDGNFLLAWGSRGQANGQFAEPMALATHGDYIYVADNQNNQVQKFNTSGFFLGSWGNMIRSLLIYKQR